MNESESIPSWINIAHQKEGPNVMLRFFFTINYSFCFQKYVFYVLYLGWSVYCDFL